MLFKAVLSDLDGTAHGTEETFERELVPYLQTHLPAWKKEDYAGFVGLTNEQIHGKLSREFGFKMTESQFLEEMGLLGDRVYQKSTLFPGYLKFLKTCRAHGKGLGLVTNSPRKWLDIFIERFSLDALIGTSVSVSDNRGYGKPHPDLYLAAAQDLQVSPRECVVLEDSFVGIQAAKAAKMGYIVGYLNGHNTADTLIEAGADSIVSDYDSLFDALDYWAD
ncbi:MAG: HAD superfamily hydrolase [Parcubacteria group bacterium Gr01-1014_18]|nr:MAG: HAD superfamily hydrolase [Parcubacteria group bacterium Greene0416_36]TSC80040.1 MAG: HAD superfamily hydrolase [Parcubacteria group bacterium Gr01-1014_18]TSC98092.1 MAG: HAD superfamily hydrolase [Parcubacteria group bacterium Greene1014_20]TSD06608.1 MAG: HAD superfamily hydrolase [Parcubacteria group bacterium Greene0714_2]